jgi:hypothetical protein
LWLLFIFQVYASDENMYINHTTWHCQVEESSLMIAHGLYAMCKWLNVMWKLCITVGKCVNSTTHLARLLHLINCLKNLKTQGEGYCKLKFQACIQDWFEFCDKCVASYRGLCCICVCRNVCKSVRHEFSFTPLWGTGSPQSSASRLCYQLWPWLLSKPLPVFQLSTLFFSSSFSVFLFYVVIM